MNSIDCRQPFISFIVPVYNVEQYLESCVKSILSQSDNDWELILIDDGSTDMSGAHCDKFASKHTKIKVIHQSNNGVSHARNVGLDKAHGKWVWFVDSDDYIVENAVSRLKEISSHYHSDTIFFGYFDDREGKRSLGNLSSNKNTFFLNKKDFLIQNFSYSNWAMVFSREVISDNLRFSNELSYAEDLEFQYKYLILCLNPISIKDPLYVYRHRDGSAMSKSNKSFYNNAFSCLTAVNNICKYLPRFNDPSLKAWMPKRINRLIKSSLNSAIKLSFKNRKHYLKCLKATIKGVKIANISGSIDLTIKIAKTNLTLYSLLLNIYGKIR